MILQESILQMVNLVSITNTLNDQTARHFTREPADKQTHTTDPIGLA